MLSKEDIIVELDKIKTQENAHLIEEYINAVNTLEDEELQKQLKEKKITSSRKIKSFIKKQIKTRHKFTKLNDMVSFGVNGRTIHIHVVPKDLHDKLNKEGLKQGELELIDALEKIRKMLKTDKRYKHINKVFAVSSIIRKPISRIFTNLDFDVKTVKTEEAVKDTDLKRFYPMFKDGKYIGRAQLGREKLLSDEWSQLVEERKEAIKGKEEDKFSNLLEEQVNVEPTVEELTIEPAKTRKRDNPNIE